MLNNQVQLKKAWDLTRIMQVWDIISHNIQRKMQITFYEEDARHENLRECTSQRQLQSRGKTTGE